MEVPKYFACLPDFRVAGRCLHVLSDIVMLVLCGLLADCEDFEQIEDYGKDKKEYLQVFLQLPNGIPSHDTMNRVFSHLNPVALEACLREWGQQIVAHLDYKHLVIDGKELRGTCRKGAKHGLTQLVSVWVSEGKLTLAQRAIQAKKNEIVAIPQVLELLDIANKVVTIDAIGCQHSIVEQIMEQKGEYVIALKANQKEVFEQVKQYVETHAHTYWVCSQQDKDHHRAEKRSYYFTTNVNAMACLGDGKECKSVWMVKASRTYQNKTTTHTRFYISSLAQVSTEQLIGFTRGHWGIENQLHWQLDVSFKEDQCHVRTDNVKLDAIMLPRIYR